VILSDEFVYLHQPKTGGTFVCEVLADIYAGRTGRKYTNWNKHGGVESIPPEFRTKPIVTTIRNPFDYYASHFHFGWWLERELSPDMFMLWKEKDMRMNCASYPYISFEEFIFGALRFWHAQILPERLVPGARAVRLGPFTLTMLYYSLPGYEETLERFFATHDTADLKRGIAKARFLHTESLNVETYRWLLDLGVPAADADPVLFKGKVQPLNTPNGQVLPGGHGQPRSTHWTSLFTPATRRAVVQNEWLFFEMFPEYSWPAECVEFEQAATPDASGLLELPRSGTGD
jgi:hypothetical protein